MSNWLIEVRNGVAYIYKRKYWLGLIAIPFYFSGGTRIVRTPDANKDVVVAAINYVYEKDELPNLKIIWRD